MLMIKMGKNSHFEVVSGDRLPKFGNKIIQIDSEKQYENRSGYGVYVVEINDEIDEKEESNE